MHCVVKLQFEDAEQIHAKQLSLMGLIVRDEPEIYILTNKKYSLFDFFIYLVEEMEL
jgi:hypothetical protein